MFVRVALISDIHIQCSTRWEETQRINTWMVDDLRHRDLDAVAIGGDVYTEAPNDEESAEAARLLRGCSETAETFGVYGNHDPYGSLASFRWPLDLSALHTGLARTTHPITFYDRPGVHEITTRRGGKAFFPCLPWPRKAQLLAAIGKPVSPDDAARVATESLRSVLRGIGQEAAARAAGTGAPRLFVGHAMVRDSRTSVGQPLIGCDFELGLDDLGLVGADAYLLGHIHLGQEWTWNGAPIIYPGSVRRTSYGEIETKRYAIVTVDGSKVSVEYVTTPTAPMLLGEDEWVSVEGAEPGWKNGWAGLLDDVQGAEIRLRYKVAADRREGAARALAALEEQLLARGAVDVQPDERVIATVQARAPEIAAAPTLDGQLAAFWAAKGIDVTGREDRLARRLAALGGGKKGRDGQLVRYDQIAMRGYGPSFPDEVTVDLASLEGPLVAVVGPNGAGKTTFLEGFAALVHRRTPTRGPLEELATRRDSYLEGRVVNGSSYRIRHTVDAHTGKGECLVTGQDGEPVEGVTGKRSFDRWAKDHLPSPELLFATTFAPQRSTGFLGLTRTERQRVILQATGCDYLEGLATKARKSHDKAIGEIDKTDALLRALGGEDPEAAEAALESATAAAELADMALEAARRAQTVAVRLAAKQKDLEREGADLAARRAEAQALADAADRRVESLRERDREQASLRARAPEVRVAAERKVALDAEIALLESTVRQLEAEIADHERTISECDRTYAAAIERSRAAQRAADARREALRAQLAERKAHSVATTAALDALQRTIARAVEIRSAQRQTEALRTEHQELAVALARLDVERQQLLDQQGRITDGIHGAEAREGRATRAVELADEALVGASETRSRAAALDDRRASLVAAEARVAPIEAEIRQVRGERTAAAGERIQGLRDGLRGVLDSTTLLSAHHVATIAVTVDDEDVARAADLPAKLSSLESTLGEANKAVRSADDLVRDAEAAAMRLPDLDRVEVNRTTAQAAATEAHQEAARLRATFDDVAVQIAAAVTAHESKASRSAAIETAIEQLGPVAALARDLDVGEERQAHLKTTLDEVAGTIARLEDELAGVSGEDAPANTAAARAIGERNVAVVAIASVRNGALSEAGKQLTGLREERDEVSGVAALAPRVEAAEAIATTVAVDLRDAVEAAGVARSRLDALPAPKPIEALPARIVEDSEHELRLAEGAARLEHGKALLARTALTTARDTAEKRRTLEADLRAFREEADDYQLLADALGRDGLQNALVDAAGPVLSVLANDLLHNCVSSRWTVSIESARLKAGGEEEIADCPIWVLDTETGVRKRAERLCGGEGVLIGEAVSLAITMHACQRAGATEPTLVRDESGAALDPDMGPRWIQMLRRAAKIVGASKLFFVSHNPVLQAMADSQLLVANGSVTVVSKGAA